LRPARANSLQNSISKIIRAKWTEGVAQVIECLFCKCVALSSDSSRTPPKKIKINHQIHSEFYVTHYNKRTSETTKLVPRRIQNLLFVQGS
jgi:hypothetical protein